jgi:hypothetical protein
MRIRKSLIETVALRQVKEIPSELKKQRKVFKRILNLFEKEILMDSIKLAKRFPDIKDTVIKVIVHTPELIILFIFFGYYLAAMIQNMD